MPQNYLCKVTKLRYPLLDVLLVFTFVESLANSRARKGVKVNVPRFEYAHMYLPQANYSPKAFKPCR